MNEVPMKQVLIAILVTLGIIAVIFGLTSLIFAFFGEVRCIPTVTPDGEPGKPICNQYLVIGEE